MDKELIDSIIDEVLEHIEVSGTLTQHITDYSLTIDRPEELIKKIKDIIEEVN